MISRNKLSISSLVIFLSVLGIAYAEVGNDYDWFFEDFEEQIDLVSEGELRFLTNDSTDKKHSHYNQITITKHSLETGWSFLSQCHNNLDALNAVQITFNEKTTRNYQIESYSKIGRVWIDNSNFELEDVEKGAVVCLKLETKNIHREKNGNYLVINGPYMRRFLDGYYPLNVNLVVIYPCDLIQFVRAKHPAQPGFEIDTMKEGNECRVDVNAHFEGKLYTRLLFTSAMK